MSDRRQRLRNARLYLICDERFEAHLDEALAGGVDIVQLRSKNLADDVLVATGRRFADVCRAAGVLFIVNDRPDLAAAIGADGAHVGQDDMPVEQAREVLGRERLLGLSTHTPEQVRAAERSAVDYVGIGPVFETPTKAGRPAVGMELVSFAARSFRRPFFAIGGIDADNVGSVLDAGASRVAVVRAITQADAPRNAARRLRAVVTANSAVVVEELV